MESVEVLFEPRRGCGYRQPGGYYVIGGGFTIDACCLMPNEVHSCASCGAGIKPARGWTWVKPEAFMDHPTGCEIDNSLRERYARWRTCPARFIAAGQEPLTGEPLAGKVGLLWIGEQFYPLPNDFVHEAKNMGISRRLTQIPRDFQAGRDWILLGHRKAVGRPPDYRPGIFMLWKPLEIQYVLQPTDRAADVDRLRKRGITPVIVEKWQEPTGPGRLYRVVPD